MKTTVDIFVIFLTVRHGTLIDWLIFEGEQILLVFLNFIFQNTDRGFH